MNNFTFHALENAQKYAATLSQNTGDKYDVVTLDDGCYGVEMVQSNNLPTIPTISFFDMMQRDYVANWLIEDLIEQSDLGLVFGSSGGGKTFVVLDMAYCIAAGISYYGKDTKKTGVLYVCGEGHSGIQKRLKAIHQEKGCLDYPNIHITTVPAAFIDRNSAIAIQNTIKAIGNIGVVFIDTFHRNLGEGDENSAKDIAKFLQNIDLYLRSIGVAVIPVHHSGNESNGRSRGSSSIRAAMDVEYEVTKSDDGIVTVRNTKMKNFEQPAPFSFKFKPVDDSVVLEPTEHIARKNKKPLTGNALIALRCLRKVIEQYGIAPPQIIRDLFPDSPENIPTKVVPIEKWRVLAYQSFTVDSETEKGKKDALKKAFQRCRTDLENSQKIDLEGGYIWQIETKLT